MAQNKRAAYQALPGLSERIKQAATERRRSRLYLWMVANHDDFKATLAAAGRPNWQALAKAFGEERLTDRLGRNPTPEGARQTWVSVRAAVSKDPGLLIRGRGEGREQAAEQQPGDTTEVVRAALPGSLRQRSSFTVASFRPTSPTKQDT